MPTTEHIWLNFGNDLRGFIARRVPNPDDAEDLLQETFVKIHRNLDGLQEDDKLAAWVYQIARNGIIDYYRRQGRGLDSLAELSEDDDWLPAEESDEAETIEQEVACWLQPMVESLTDKYRQALWLTEYEGLSQVDLAVRLGISVSGAKSRVQRGRAMLRQQLLDCCQFDFDRRGGIIGYRPRIELVEMPFAEAQQPTSPECAC